MQLQKSTSRASPRSPMEAAGIALSRIIRETQPILCPLSCRQHAEHTGLWGLQTVHLISLQERIPQREKGDKTAETLCLMRDNSKLPLPKTTSPDPAHLPGIHSFLSSMEDGLQKIKNSSNSLWPSHTLADTFCVQAPTFSSLSISNSTWPSLP